MKTRTLLFAILMMFSGLMYGQTYIWESFDSGQMPPSGWTISAIPQQWSVSNSSNAGGSAPEGMFTYTSGSYTSRLISPMVDLTGLTSVKFSFKHFYDWYSNPAPKIGVATRSHNGAWNIVYEKSPTANLGPEQVDLDINNSDVGQTEFQICVYLNGNMYNIDYYYVDNMLLFNPLNKDAALISLGATPTYFSDPSEVKGTIMNMGLSTITDFDIQWQLDGGTIYTSNFTGLSLATQQAYDFTCTDLINAMIGGHNVQVWIKNVNGSPDDFHGNDTLEKQVFRICHVVPKKPLFEEFTSSTCSPCASFNAGFVPWCNAHEDDITLIKYQMNWPGNGDPYYTEEGGVRRDFYNVNFVPDFYLNGSQVPTDVGAVQSAFDDALLQMGMMKIAATHKLDGHVISVDASILPFSDFANCFVQIAVMEKVTHNNVATNGETSFEHVMMKMVPNAHGTGVNFTDRVPVNIKDTVDLTGTHVEEWNDLIVGVFVQDSLNRTMFQSLYSIEDGSLSTEARLSEIRVDGQLLNNFSSNTFTYEVRLNPWAVVVPAITALPIDTNETVIIVGANELPGTTTIDVYAENLMTHNLYSVNFTPGGVGTDDQKMSAMSFYPNPTKGKIYFQNAEHARIILTSADGHVIMKHEDFTGSSIDLQGLAKGVYLLKIDRPGHPSVTKKIVLL